VAKNSVLAIQVGLGAMAQKELTAAGVAACVGHRQAAGLVLLGVDLAGDRVAGAAGAGRTAGAFAAVGTAPLGHEAFDHPVEGEAVVEAVLGELDEVRDGAGGLGVKQINDDRPGVGVHQGLGHGRGGKLRLYPSRAPCFHGHP